MSETRWFLTESAQTWHVHWGPQDNPNALCRSNVKPRVAHRGGVSEDTMRAYPVPTPKCIPCTRKLAMMAPTDSRGNHSGEVRVTRSTSQGTESGNANAGEATVKGAIVEPIPGQHSHSYDILMSVPMRMMGAITGYSRQRECRCGGRVTEPATVAKCPLCLMAIDPSTLLHLHSREILCSVFEIRGWNCEPWAYPHSLGDALGECRERSRQSAKPWMISLPGKQPFVFMLNGELVSRDEGIRAGRMFNLTEGN